MGKLEGAVASIMPVVPSPLSKCIYMAATTCLTEIEARTFTKALDGILIQLVREEADFEELPIVSALFTENGDFTYIEDEDCFGRQLNLAVYPMRRIREKGFHPDKLLVIYLEELCHVIWRISNEITVKHKVTEVYSWVYGKQLRIEQLYLKDWLEAEKERQKQG